MQPKYQWVKVLKPFCPLCKKQLRGNNSVVSPYTCECGEWKYDVENGGWNVRVKYILEDNKL